MILLLSVAAGAALLLVGSGVTKLRGGGAAVRAIRVLVPRAPGGLGAAVGLGEIAVGVAFLVAPRPVTATVLGAAYLGLSLFAATIRRSAVDCGCFGAGSAPVSGAHVAVTGTAAAIGGALAIVGVPDLPVVALLVAYAGGAAFALLGFGYLAPLSRLRSELAALR